MTKVKSAYGRGTGKSHPVDIYVGARLRARRTLLGMTQTDLGDTAGLTFQQIQKYERGTNRVSASRLYDLCRVLDVPVNFFFDGLISKAKSPAKRRGGAEEPVSFDLDLMARRETLQFVRAYYGIENADIRKRVYELTKAVGAADA